jgi:hypothetical protein
MHLVPVDLPPGGEREYFSRDPLLAFRFQARSHQHDAARVLRQVRTPKNVGVGPGIILLKLEVRRKVQRDRCGVRIAGDVVHSAQIAADRFDRPAVRLEDDRSSLHVEPGPNRLGDLLTAVRHRRLQSKGRNKPLRARAHR